MNHFWRVKQPDGSYQMQLVERPRMPDNPIQPPPGMVLPGSTKKFMCKLCNKSFNTLGVYSIHFKKEHSDQYRDKDSWRGHVKDTTTGVAR